jgi:hypothetical protein
LEEAVAERTLGSRAGKRTKSLDEAIGLVELPLITDGRGNLTFLEGGRHIPFQIARVYYLYDVPEGQMRAGHAHYQLQQIMIACSGKFDLHLDNGAERRIITMDRPNKGLLIKSLVWREIHGFSKGAVCLVLGSLPYSEADYIRDYQTFLNLVRG